MDSKFRNTVESFTKEYIPVLSTLVAAVVTIRLLEFTMVAYSHGSTLLNLNDVASALLNDLQLMTLISLPVSALYVLLKGMGAFIRTTAIATIIGLTSSVGLLLALNYSATLSPLGPELWAYNINEITDTVIEAENHLMFKLGGLLIFIGFLVIALNHLMKFIATYSERIRLGVMVTVFGLTALGTALSQTIGENNPEPFISNKLSYFVSAGLSQSTESTNELGEQLF